MMTIGNHGGAGGASAYFDDHLARGDYYVASPGRWHPGKAARALGLPQEVSARHFAAVAAGFGLDGRPLIQRAGPGHRAGWDLCFSAPKSVSVVWSQASVESRARIARAHERAVEAALALLQREAIRVRVGKGGVGQLPAEPLASLFAHETSRLGDPQLHTHCFVHNCALRSDGKWGAIESRYLYQWQTAVGTAYRAQLADELRRLGYGIVSEGRAFALAGVPDEACKEFARRRQEILLVATRSGVSTPAEMEVVALATRGKKAEVDRAALFESWLKRGRSVGFGDVQAQRLARAPDSTLASIDVEEVLKTLTSHHAVFGIQNVFREVSERVQIAGGGTQRVQSLVSELMQSGALIQVSSNRYTTRDMLQVEREVMMAAGRMALRKGFACEATKVFRPLSSEQRRALDHVIGAAGFAVLEGRAGAGKSYMLGAALECWERAGFRVLGAALAGKAAEGLQSGSGIRCSTLHSMLAAIDSGRLQLNDRTVLVIDEAGMVGTRQMQRLISAADAASAKVVLVGDSKQLQSIDAGGVFRRLSQEFRAVEMAEIRRQRDPVQREMVVDLMEGNAAEALRKLERIGGVHVCDGEPAVVGAMVENWIHLFASKHPSLTLMLAATRADVRQVNVEARRVLRERGVLGESETMVSGSAFASGDRVLFMRNDRDLGVKNGTLGTIREVDESVLDVELDDGRTVRVNSREYPHLTHGYCVTVHKAQGVTADHVMVFASERMASREWGYVAGSRHRVDVKLYCDRSCYAGIAEDLSQSDAKSMAIDEIDAHALDLEPI